MKEFRVMMNDAEISAFLISYKNEDLAIEWLELLTEVAEPDYINAANKFFQRNKISIQAVTVSFDNEEEESQYQWGLIIKGYRMEVDETGIRLIKV